MADYKYTVRKLDENGDMCLSGSVWLYDIDAVTQTINTRLKLFSKEYWRDVSEGTPWLKEILGKTNSQNTLSYKENLIKDRMLGTFGVLSILEWSSDFDNSSRKLSIKASILTEFGATSITYES